MMEQNFDHEKPPSDCIIRIKTSATRSFKRLKLRFEDGEVEPQSKLNRGIYQNNTRLGVLFYKRPCIDLAKNLLGKIAVRKLPNGELLKAKIVETECYLGGEDKASHSYNGKLTDRNAAMFMEPGTAYVYSIYGMYYCFNISSLGEGSAVLIRAMEPLMGLDCMREARCSQKKSSTKPFKDKDLCNGPSKLCQALKIEKQTFNKENLCSSNTLWIEDGDTVSECNIICCKRIGINSAGAEWIDKPLRFYIKNCIFVSVRNKSAESNSS